jgi:hypothetical protein
MLNVSSGEGASHPGGFENFENAIFVNQIRKSDLENDEYLYS